MRKQDTLPVRYANHVQVMATDSEIVLNFHFRTKEKGLHTLAARIILPPQEALALGQLLASLSEDKERDGK